MNWKLILSMSLSVWLCAISSFVAHASDERPQCEPKQLQAFRKEMEARFKKDSKSQVIDEMESRWNACQYTFSESVDVKWLASDLALYLYKTNQKRQCKNLFCAPANVVDCDHSRQKQPWDKPPSNAEKALITNVEKCLKTSETGIDDVKLVDEYKSKKVSVLPICQKGQFTYLRFHPVKNDLNEVNTFIVIASSAKEAAELREEDRMTPPFLVWAGDVNGDGLNDLLINKGGCGSRAECNYQLYANCGKGKYVDLLHDTQYAYAMQVSKSKSVIDGTVWSNLDATFRHSDYELGCDGHLGDFVYPVKFTFDGERYVISKAERIKNAKEVEGRRKEIRQQCLKAK